MAYPHIDEMLWFGGDWWWFAGRHITAESQFEWKNVNMRRTKLLDRKHVPVRSDVFLHDLELSTLEALRRVLEQGLVPSDLNISGDDEPIVVLRFTQPHVEYR
jgi:hypothetical protein